jgi:hypothetical protein
VSEWTRVLVQKQRLRERWSSSWQNALVDHRFSVSLKAASTFLFPPLDMEASLDLRSMLRCVLQFHSNPMLVIWHSKLYGLRNDALDALCEGYTDKARRDTLKADMHYSTLFKFYAQHVRDFLNPESSLST